MNDIPPTSSDGHGPSNTAPEPGPGRAGPRRMLAFLPAITFVLGVVFGGVMVGVAGRSEGSGADQAPVPTPSQRTSPSTGDTLVALPQECLAVADTVDQLTQLVRDNLDAIREFRSHDIVEMLNRLEDLDQQARDQADACRDIQLDTVTPGPSGDAP